MIVPYSSPHKPFLHALLRTDSQPDIDVGFVLRTDLQASSGKRPESMAGKFRKFRKAQTRQGLIGVI